VFQQAALDALKINARYEAWEVPPSGLASRIEELRNPIYLGANVTIPHKESAMDLVDELDPLAEKIGSLNTIVNRKGKLLGYNTDAGGFLKALKSTESFDPKGANVLIIGAGGAARAAVCSLLGLNISRLVIANRTLDRAISLGKYFSSSIEVSAIGMNDSRLTEYARRSKLIINCTSMGMKNGPAEQLSPLGSTAIQEGSLVCDMVYNPAMTPLLVEAIKSGASTLGGVSMLIYQGAAAFELWTDTTPPIGVMFRAAKKALELNQ
tara:strand:- start:429 stop:1226 length:798 start_codon:yes stop_codon:yes gene_type:complete